MPSVGVLSPWMKNTNTDDDFIACCVVTELVLELRDSVFPASLWNHALFVLSILLFFIKTIKFVCFCLLIYILSFLYLFWSFPWTVREWMWCHEMCGTVRAHTFLNAPLKSTNTWLERKLFMGIRKGQVFFS